MVGAALFDPRRVLANSEEKSATAGILRDSPKDVISEESYVQVFHFIEQTQRRFNINLAEMFLPDCMLADVPIRINPHLKLLEIIIDHPEFLMLVDCFESLRHFIEAILIGTIGHEFGHVAAENNLVLLKQGHSEISGEPLMQTYLTFDKYEAGRKEILSDVVTMELFRVLHRLSEYFIYLQSVATGALRLFRPNGGPALDFDMLNRMIFYEALFIFAAEPNTGSHEVLNLIKATISEIIKKRHVDWIQIQSVKNYYGYLYLSRTPDPGLLVSDAHPGSSLRAPLKKAA